jgi:hypothetical protein
MAQALGLAPFLFSWVRELRVVEQNRVCETYVGAGRRMACGDITALRASGHRRQSAANVIPLETGRV